MSVQTHRPDELGHDYLEIRGLTVDFDGFKAIDGVDLTLLQGRLHFLIGPNGAGKTTLVDAVTGLVQGTGRASYRNQDLLSMKSHRRTSRRPWPPSGSPTCATGPRACWRTGRSSGWRSACCSSRTRR